MIPSMALTVRTLTDGGQRPEEIAQLVADFVSAAQASLDVALYDLNLGPTTERLVVGALEQAAERGGAIRLVFNAAHRNPIPVPAPPQSPPDDIARLGVPTRAIPGVPDLMHHKFVVRDGSTVWTGSTNWTDDSWGREENVLVMIDSPGLATAYTVAFEQLWRTGDVAASGGAEPRPVDVEGKQVRPWFCPGFGDALSHRMAKAIGRARRRIRICSPVITAAP